MGSGTLPLVVSPIINNITVSKMLVDGGSSIKLISAVLMDKLQISEAQLLPTSPFQGVSLVAVQPLGKLVLLVTFGPKEKYHTKNVMVDVSEIPLPYHGLLGRSALAKFMAVMHHTYNVLKIPTTWGVLTVKPDVKDAVACIKQTFQALAAATPGGRGLM